MKYYLNGNYFTLALLVMPVTNITSGANPLTNTFCFVLQKYIFPTVHLDLLKGHLTPIVQVSFSDLNMSSERSTETCVKKRKFGHLACTPSPVDMKSTPSEHSEHRLECARDHGTH